ncbi:MAG: diaminopimelate epimerase [Lentisphaerae bacterium GWF2_49_21]|nr:MAG: diaminopimelate epimerase [Lentisphaerae bacterium GWF2_49_21]
MEFTKMHGAGNDFIVVFDPSRKFPRKPETIMRLCSRNRGVGADGLILLSNQKKRGGAFRMEFFNSDGSIAGMCGNGLRCAGLFCHNRLKAGKNVRIKTDSGILEAVITGKETARVSIPVKTLFKEIILEGRKMYFGNTGVPHLVIPVKDIEKADVLKDGRKFRFHRKFAPAGTNVNFISIPGKGPVRIRTYERGVEGETSACGTGITASAVTLFSCLDMKPPFEFLTVDGDLLKVDFCKSDNMLCTPRRAFLTGPAVEVFSGTIIL